MDTNKAAKELAGLYKAREKLFPIQRQAVRLCAKGIRQVHTGKTGEAKKTAKEASGLIKGLEKAVKKFPRLGYLLSTPYQEYAELMVLLSVVETGKMPKLAVPADAYLLGSLDAVGELKRACMELLASGKKQEAIRLFAKMEGIYYSMQEFEFPNSIVGGFKQKQDAMKAVLERLHHTIAEARMRQ